MMRTRIFWAGAAAALGLAACGGPEPIEQPTPPDMRETVQGFAAPRGRFTQDTAGEVLDDALERFGVASGIGGLGFLPGIVGGAGGGETAEGELRSHEQPLALGGSTFEGEGFITIKHTCPGWEGGTTPDPADGSVGLTANFSDAGIEPVIWGGFNACRWDFDGVQAELEPDVAFFVGDAFNLEAPDASNLVFALTNGTIALDDQLFTQNLELSLTEDGLAVLVDVPGGEVVFAPTEAAIEIRDADGTWLCDLEAGQCARGSDTISF